MLKATNFVGSQPKKIAPEIRITMEIIVLNNSKDSTGDTSVTRHRRYSFVAEIIT
jgi:hypothetical protein